MTKKKTLAQHSATITNMTKKTCPEYDKHQAKEITKFVVN
jgi:hypothetical protein